MDLKALYREVILDHYKKPRNTAALEHTSIQARCKNPSCGDRVTLSLDLDNGLIKGVCLEGTGCAISQASASMMTMAIKGQSLERAEQILQAFRGMIVQGDPEPQQELLGDLLTLQGVSQLHARVKCALCGWSALEAALEERHGEEVDLELDQSLPRSSAGG
ncbi:SUF system NifU family Fe-S cluster assembly protein [bacterium]|nr:SUF system NifU family Fe-S cluster assembly protein [bacterium]